MTLVTCSVCDNEMEIDSINGVAYVTEQNGDIHHDYDCEVGEGDGQQGD